MCHDVAVILNVVFDWVAYPPPLVQVQAPSPVILTEVFRGSPQAPYPNTVMVSEIRLQPPPPTSLSVHCSPIIAAVRDV
jgi:hypothetical protein